jgi:hypothetical protein
MAKVMSRKKSVIVAAKSLKAKYQLIKTKCNTKPFFIYLLMHRVQ